MDKKKPIVLEYQELLNKQIKSLGNTIFCMSTIAVIGTVSDISTVSGGDFSVVESNFSEPPEVDADTIKTLVDTQLKLMRAVLSLEGVDIPLEYPEGTFEDDVKQVETAAERREHEDDIGYYARV